VWVIAVPGSVAQVRRRWRGQADAPAPTAWLAIIGTLGALTGLAGCIPKTDLAAETNGGEGAASGAVGPKGSGVAAASLVDPAAGATGVPVNLAAVWVKFPGPVSLPDGALAVATSGVPAALAALESAACPDASPAACLRVGLAGVLSAGATYLVDLGPGVMDLEGHEVPAGPVGQFVTAPDADLTAPVIDALTVQPLGPCVSVAFTTDEPAQATIRIESAAGVRRISAGAGVTEFTSAVSLVGLGAGDPLLVIAEVEDRAGNRAESAAVGLTVPPDLLPLAITEVLANPAGAEPTQEFVELRNLGDQPVELQGLAIADAKGMDVLPAARLDPGAYALIVASGFDAASPKDTPPRAGVALVRIDTRIGSDGLSNGGEVVRLLSARGNVVSSYGAAVDVSAASWSGKSVHRIPEAACDQEASWTRHPEAPTPGWGAP